MKKILLSILMLCALVSCESQKKFSNEELLDKIKGGWAGQTIGVTFGGPTEFRYVGRIIEDSIQLTFPEGKVKWYFDNEPGIFDDIYMDLTFVDVFEKKGLDADINDFAEAFTYAPYPLWHANRAARANFHAGIKAPDSGHWRNNSHCSDIDFQIEADYAGLMAPGMVNTATYYTDDIGHIMNYGDGWYGGVYVAAMYSLAFIYNDIYTIVNEALKTIPVQSDYYQCMSDIISWHKENPNDWKYCWNKAEEKWGHVTHCTYTEKNKFNIDAKINSAYILIGLLYGEGDFKKTTEISTRCGQDSDCNPASAAGILGTMIGYSNIPADWLAIMQECEDLDFVHTDISLNDAYKLSFKHAKEVIAKNGGKVTDKGVVIKVQEPVAVRYEKCYDGLKRCEHIDVHTILSNKVAAEAKFNGVGVVAYHNRLNIIDPEEPAIVEIWIDGKLDKTMELPMNKFGYEGSFYNRFDLENGEHTIKIVHKNYNRKGNHVRIGMIRPFVKE